MNAGLELIRDIAVADAALVRKRLAEGLGLRLQQLMGTAVAEGAIGSGAVLFSLFLAVKTLPELRGLILVAGNTPRLWEIGRVWKDIVGFMTRVACQGAMRTLRELGPLIRVAGDAIGPHQGVSHRESEQQ